MRLRAGAATSTGRIRELNEDVYIVRAQQGLIVVCDLVAASFAPLEPARPRSVRCQRSF
jgi:hypothetical protein